MSPRTRASRAVYIIGSAILVVGTSILVNFATGASLEKWDSAASLVSILAAVAGFVGATATVFFSERAANAAEEADNVKNRLAIQLLNTLSDMEREVRKIEGLNPERTDRIISLREIGKTMIATQNWNTHDRIGFDLAIRARNSIVHNDLDSLDVIDLTYASEKAEQLLQKMRHK
ncbi:hypothetical protein ABZ912_53540 [Nonomuraea angiospora]|uniref:hypothetical protein n=1 Tax=Nonomuraea angiospora TaxID=46172 RepID=UPI003406DCBD